MLARWLADPEVLRRWSHEHTPEAVERDFGPAVDRAEPTDVFVASADGEPFGLIQRYRVDAYPEYVEELAAVVELPPGALSIDYLIGEPSRRGCGLGAAMIAALVSRNWDEVAGAATVIVPVHASNVASWRALAAVGFRRVAECELIPDNPADTRDHIIYRLDRP